MIVAADFLNSLDKRRLAKVERFLDDAGVGAERFVIAPIRPPHGAEVVVTYYDTWFHDSRPKATIEAKTLRTPLCVQTSLSNATQLIRLLYAEKTWWDRLIDLDLDRVDEGLFALLGLDSTSLLKPKVAGWQEGRFVAPLGDAYAYFSVDVHGGVSIEAEARRLGEVLFQLAAMTAFSELRLDEKSSHPAEGA
jgi:hypothetical protein